MNNLRSGIPFLLLALAACHGNHVAPGHAVLREAPTLLRETTTLRCQVDVPSAAMKCEPATSPPRSRGAGPQWYARLTATNASYDATTEIFAADVELRTARSQPIGTGNVEYPGASGTRVIFSAGPTVTSGSGTVTVANADGGGSSTTPEAQPFFMYTCALDSGGGQFAECGSPDTPAPRWEWNVPRTVNTFAFTATVDANTRFPDGFVFLPPTVLPPSTSVALVPRVVDAYGHAVPDAVGEWWSSDEIVTVDARGTVSAGSQRGITQIGANSGPRWGVTSVVVCPVAPVADGSRVVGSIATDDCPAFRSVDGTLPYTNYFADYFTVSLAAGETVHVTLSTAGFAAYLSLAGPDGLPVARTRNGDGASPGIRFTAPASGTYRIQATTERAGETGSYTLGVEITRGR